MGTDAMWWLLAGMAAVVCAAVAAGVEIGLYSINRVRLDLRAQKPDDAAARIIRAELEKPSRLLATIMIATSIANSAGTYAMDEFWAGTGMDAGPRAFINAIVLGPILFVFGDALPKELFRVEADRLTYMFARVIVAVRVGLTWTGLLPVVQACARLAERVSGLREEAVSDARQRMLLLLKEGAGAGVLSESQVTLLDRALVFRGVTVGDEMRPWWQVKTVQIDWDRRRVLLAIGDASHSRVPVVDRLGRVVGVMRQIDLHLKPQASVKELMQPAVKLSRGMSVVEALQKMREGGSRIGVVEDEVGRAIGLATSKDLVEPLTGELADL
jgi:putative hemolysin